MLSYVYWSCFWNHYSKIVWIQLWNIIVCFNRLVKIKVMWYTYILTYFKAINYFLNINCWQPYKRACPFTQFVSGARTATRCEQTRIKTPRAYLNRHVSKCSIESCSWQAITDLMYVCCHLCWVRSSFCFRTSIMNRIVQHFFECILF